MDTNSLINELHLMQQSYATLFSVVNKVQTRGDEYMEILTSRQHMALIAIAHLPTETATLTNISKKLGTTKQTANKLMTGLIKKGYVKSVPNQKDKRSINIEMTAEGKKVLVDCSERSVYFLADLFHRFTAEEVATFWRLLQKLYRFDGEEQDGFEENANIQLGVGNSLDTEKILGEFEKRRYGGENDEK
ncbi:MarR family winged helix-turn-helix transcriptional regulator [Bacillus paralicheniformis]|uniref:MarR family winged helix-turn-helix transcriptional regulator n=1 Tax=Bacillus paralicheniformis TaxID=1648923 RepID=UPI0034D2E54D